MVDTIIEYSEAILLEMNRAVSMHSDDIKLEAHNLELMDKMLVNAEDFATRHGMKWAPKSAQWYSHGWGM